MSLFASKKSKFAGLFGLVCAFALACVLVGCASGGMQEGGSDATSADSSAASSAAVADLTVTPGKLTIATGNPAYPPYVMDDAPESGQGFEAALAYAVAERMGFAAEDVVWVRTGFDEAITPGAKDWDMNIQQFGITEDRKQAVDFSSPYFTPAQSVVVDAAEGHDAYVNATSCADLADAVLGAEAGSTSYTWGMEKINDKIQVFNSNADAANALNAHQIDGIIVDTPTAVYMADPEMEELASAVLVGQIADSQADPLAFLLPKGSALTSAVSDAIDELEADGTLQELTDTWMAAYTTDVFVLD